MALEEGIDLGFVNYRTHPENKNYSVFRFKDPVRAEYFEKQLTEENIWFERATQEVNGKDMVLFGVHYRDFEKAQQINFKTESIHRNPFIKNKAFRYFVLLFTIGFIILAIISYMKQ